MADPRTALVLAALRKHPELDPQAVLAVFRQEGLSGGIGDSGHAFGPAQMNDAGGVLTGKLAGQSPQQKNAWAWSSAGIESALSGISGVAAGQHGSQAINSIVRNYERPADPNGEVARALGGRAPAGMSGGGAQAMSRSPSLGAASPDRRAFAQQLLAAISPTGQLNDPGALLGALQARRAPQMVQGPNVSPLASAASGGGGGGIAELLREGTGGPTHSTGPHIHAAFTDPQLELAAIQKAQALGLHVGENPYLGGVAPVHAPNSYHGRDFAGTYNGRKLGEAFDSSGSPAQMDAFYQWLAQRKER